MTEFHDEDVVMDLLAISKNSASLSPLILSGAEQRATRNAEPRISDTVRSLRAAFAERDSLFASLDQIEPTLNRVRSGKGRGESGTVLSSALVLGQHEEATLTSTEEVNASPTSFATREPVFTATSTSGILIGGTYDGSSGDDTLPVSVIRGGTVGSGGNPSIKLRVRDSVGLIANLDIDQAAAEYTPVDIGNGMTVSFSNGDVVKDDEFTVGVSTTTPSAVDPDMAFNGFGDNSPGFE